MDMDADTAAERCLVEVLPGGLPPSQKFMMDRLEDKVYITAYQASYVPLIQI